MEASSKLARPYAVAAFNQARDEANTQGWSEMLGTLTTIVSDPTMKGVLASPKVDNKQLAGLIIDVAGDALSATGRNFVRTLAQYGRLGLIADIKRQYEEERARVESLSHIVVTSAFDLDEGQRKLIIDAMQKRLGTDVDLEVETDTSLIGGCVIRAGDVVIDASLRGRLSKLALALS
ncbi:MAG: F0F1 ATP synthase subunit delta [Gammaproteobacteria bacterium]|nr:F0F1 ATP synthase subunit delta [Gammaproteobacteria bacterium]